MIDKDYLETELKNMKQQLVNAQAVVQQATGAILLLESLLVKANEKSMTLKEFGEAIGQDNLTIEEVK